MYVTVGSGVPTSGLGWLIGLFFLAVRLRIILVFFALVLFTLLFFAFRFLAMRAPAIVRAIAGYMIRV